MAIWHRQIGTHRSDQEAFADCLNPPVIPSKYNRLRLFKQDDLARHYTGPAKDTLRKRKWNFQN